MAHQRNSLPALPTGNLTQFIVGGFLARYPRKTREHYAISIRQWNEWCAAHGIDMLEARRAHIEAWGRYLEEDRGLMISTVASKLNAICGLYRFAAIDDLIDHDPSTHVRRPKIEFVSKTNGMTRPQMADMLRAAEDDGPTTYALICLLGLNGLRLGWSASDANKVEHLGFPEPAATAAPLFLPHRQQGRQGRRILAPRGVRTPLLGRRALARQGAPRDRYCSGAAVGGPRSRRPPGASCSACADEIGATKRITRTRCGTAFVTMALDAGAPERDIIDFHRPRRLVDDPLLRSQQRRDRAQRHPRRRRLHWSSELMSDGPVRVSTERALWQ